MLFKEGTDIFDDIPIALEPMELMEKTAEVKDKADFLCRFCREKWFVEVDKKLNVSCCPFCGKALYKPGYTSIDSVEIALLKVIDDNGAQILENPDRFAMCLEKASPDFQKEKKIIIKSCDSETLKTFYEATKLNKTEAQNKFKLIEKKLIEEEAIAEAWAKRICHMFFGALFVDNSTTDDVAAAVKKADIGDKKIKGGKFFGMTPEEKLNSYTTNTAKTIESHITKSKGDIGGIVTFGKLNWRVIDRDYDSVLLLAAESVKNCVFEPNGKKTTWSISYLRRWLNSDYLKNNFSPTEISFIIKSRIRTNVNKEIFPDVSQYTDDLIYIFSKDAAEKYKEIMKIYRDNILLRTTIKDDFFVLNWENRRLHESGISASYPACVLPVVRVKREYFER